MLILCCAIAFADGVVQNDDTKDVLVALKRAHDPQPINCPPLPNTDIW